jgi:hypothetical protein
MLYSSLGLILLGAAPDLEIRMWLETKRARPVPVVNPNLNALLLRRRSLIKVIHRMLTVLNSIRGFTVILPNPNRKSEKIVDDKSWYNVDNFCQV